VSEPVAFRVVLVEPQYEGNVGAVARVCANFGVDDLVVVEGPELTDRADIMAMHADDLLERARRVDTLEEATEDAHLTVGFTAEPATKPQDHRRSALELPEAADRARAMQGTSALVFGREADGLGLGELTDLDLVSTIPVAPAYPSMNLSHAVAVALYEAAGRDACDPTLRPEAASRRELETLFTAFEELMRETGFREHKLEPALVCLRRVFGRTRLSTWEYHRVMGVLSKALKALDAWPEDGSLDT
jgi:tRNA/rRNA methyltransferase